MFKERIKHTLSIILSIVLLFAIGFVVIVIPFLVFFGIGKYIGSIYGWNDYLVVGFTLILFGIYCFGTPALLDRLS